MTKPIIVVRVPCKLLYVIQVKEFLIKCLTSWPYLISEFLVAYITIVASDWPRTFFTPKVFLFSIVINETKRPSGEHSRRYNRPLSDEIGVLMPNDVTNNRDIVLHYRDGGLKHISELHRAMTQCSTLYFFQTVLMAGM